MMGAEELTAEEAARRARIGRAWASYYGREGRPARCARDAPEDRVALNFARVVADKGVAFLFGDGVGFEVKAGPGADGSAVGEAQGWLERIWEASGREATLGAMALNGAVCGQAFLRIGRHGDGEHAGLPRVAAPDPGAVRVRTRPDDCSEAVELRIGWDGPEVEGSPTRMEERLERTGEVWRLTLRSSGDGREWRTERSEIWPHPWSPVMSCQNLAAPNVYWGLSDLEDDLLAVCGAINRVMSDLARVIRLHAHPRTWGSGFTAETLDLAVDGVTVLPSPEARLANLEMQSDLSASLDYSRRLKEWLHEMAQVPELATGRVESLGALSGVALQILYQPLLERTRTKRRLYGELLRSVNRRLLGLGGFGGLAVEVRWPDPMPLDLASAAAAGDALLRLGVSQDTVLARLGFDAGHERAKRAAEVGRATGGGG